MGISIEVERVKLPDGRYVAWFHPTVSEDVDVESLPMVSLARNPDHCYFRIDKLHEHDKHSPPMADKDAVNAYIKRVMDEVIDGLAKVGVQLEETTTEDCKAIPVASVHPINPGHMPGGTLTDDSDN